MKKKQVFTVTDLGGGDGGKGGVVHKICVAKKAHTVIKAGGAQGSHGVKTSAGQRFNFSQFGCGTFEGVKTYLSSLIVIEPLRLLAEAEELQFEWGIGNVWSYLTVDDEALCATPFHTIASRLRELARKDNPKGTIGVGIGEAKLDSEIHPELAIYAKDLNQSSLRDKLWAVREQKLLELEEIIENSATLWTVDQEMAQREIDLIQDEDFVDWVADQFRLVASRVKIVDRDFLVNEILSPDGVVVVESSHGVLTDKFYGFHPNTSRLRTIPQTIWNFLHDLGYDGEVVRLGVTRAYQIRHGAGAMVTEDQSFVEELLPGSSKDENRWQGKVRVGPLDLVALRYAIEVCGGPQVFHGLAISWFDQIKLLGRWPMCDRYLGADDPNFFGPDGQIKVSHQSGDEQLVRQAELSRQLSLCRPEITSFDLKGFADERELAGLCSETLLKALGVPVRMISFGPTEADKVLL
ncbi:MAG: adenylosuccinate synthetase [Candidatus Paceibacterota bacterium]|jgi:adenylosuccinate synthase